MGADQRLDLEAGGGQLRLQGLAIQRRVEVLAAIGEVETPELGVAADGDVAIGGTVNWESGSAGTRFTLWLPLEQVAGTEFLPQ